jgi:hypothetical protein
MDSKSMYGMQFRLFIAGRLLGCAERYNQDLNDLHHDNRTNVNGYLMISAVIMTLLDGKILACKAVLFGRQFRQQSQIARLIALTSTANRS